jgi:hypothetical protein
MTPVYVALSILVAMVFVWLVVQAVVVARLVRAGRKPGGLALVAWGLQVGGAFMGPLALLLVPLSVALAAAVVVRARAGEGAVADRTAGVGVFAGGLALCVGFAAVLYAVLTMPAAA